jgi:uncharacterized protein (TIGR02246 family)
MEAIMKLVIIGVAMAFILVPFAIYQNAEAQSNDPQSVVQRFNDAQNAGDVETALAMWAEDGVRTNSRGRKMAGKEEIRKFIQGVVAAKMRVETESLDVLGDKVIWNILETNELYRKLGIAPVRVVVHLLVQEGKIKSWIAYLPLGEIARIEEACTGPQGEGALISGQPCKQMIEQIRAQTASVIGSSTSDNR